MLALETLAFDMYGPSANNRRISFLNRFPS